MPALRYRRRGGRWCRWSPRGSNAAHQQRVPAGLVGASVDLRCRIGRRPRRAPAGAQRSVRWVGGSFSDNVFVIVRWVWCWSILVFSGLDLCMNPRVHARERTVLPGGSAGVQAEGHGEGRCCCRAFGRRLRGGAGGGSGGSGVRRRAARASSRAAAAAAASAWATTTAAPAAATAAAAWATATAAVRSRVRPTEQQHGPT